MEEKKNMKKLINGKVVDIKNMNLFEMAAEGLALQRTATSNTSDALDTSTDSVKIRRLIKQYDLFYKYMPYPLYAIEQDIKYAALGSFLKKISNEKMDMWIDNGLNIIINQETGMTLKIVNNTWSLVYTKESRIDNVDMQYYKDSIGFDEYTWVLNKIISKENTGDFYKVFMPDFVAACNGQSMIIKWELENMLTFGKIPNRMTFKANRIIDTDKELEYSLDIYFTGYAVVDDGKKVSRICADGMCREASKPKIKTYEFEAYSKACNSSMNNKQTKCNVNGLHSLFLELCGIKSANEMATFPDFYGMIQDNNLVFTIDRTLFVAKANRLLEPIDIASGVELYAVESNKVYFIKSYRINDSITKDVMYSYNIKEKTTKLCKILFNY